jgi:uncharacterized protein YijF (DUF1287 family)
LRQISGGVSEYAPDDAQIEAYTEQRAHYIEIVRNLRLQHPDIAIDKLTRLAQAEALKQKHKSANYYRIQATRQLVGGGDILTRRLAEINGVTGC